VKWTNKQGVQAKQSGDRLGCKIEQALMLSQLRSTKSGARFNLQSLSFNRRMWRSIKAREIPRTLRYEPESSAVRPIFARREFEL